MNIAILFGGRSAEHEISLMSAKNVFENLDKSRYNPILIKIDRTGKWLTDIEMSRKMSFGEIHDFTFFNPTDEILLQPGADFPILIGSDINFKLKIDAVFPVLHGPNGEDGTVQGVLKLLGIPFIGPSLLGSAVGMDKEVMKRLLKDAGIKIGDYIVARYGFVPDFDSVKNKLGLPVFVKPANMGSSVGITKVREENQYEKAVQLAYNFDTKIVIEANIEGREIECAILGNEHPRASIPGEIRATKDFYDYESKYLDDKGYELTIPAKVDKETIEKIREIAVKTFQVLECEGLSRVDVFLKNNNEVFVNEINTIPGFTSISMYPMLWKETGINYQDLISSLIELAISRFKRDNGLKTSL